MSTSAASTVPVDAAIVGGGVAGAWLLRLLTNKGFNVVLLERDAIGCDQTLASQGMIHGGLKYALNGVLTGASEAIAGMPDRWRSCLAGEGDVDLRSVERLSEAHYMFAATATGKFASLVGSFALRARIERLKKDDFPTAFDGFNGSVYRLNEFVLDTASLLRALLAGLEDRSFALDCSATNVERNSDGFRIQLCDATLDAGCLISCAGNGTDALLDELGVAGTPVQHRALKQVVVKPAHGVKLYGHCLTNLNSDEPRLTITTHPGNGRPVWYLGGQLATEGVARSDAEQIAQARQELEQCVGWLDWSNAEYSVLSVDRAEPAQVGGLKPDRAYVRREGSFIQCFPTKLTLTPDMGDQVLEVLDAPSAANGELASNHPRAPMGQSPWN